MTIKKYRWDLLVIGLLLLLGLILLLVVTLTKTEGNYVYVEIDNVSAGKYPLSEDGVFPLNGGTNTLVIENGEAYVIDSHCRDHRCEQMGRIRYVGQFIKCLPNRVELTVRGTDTAGGVDLVS